MLSIRSIAVLTAAVVTLAASVCATADDNGKSYAFKIGASYVQTAAMQPNDTWLSLGAEAKLPAGLIPEGESRLCLDYAQRSQNGQTGSITSLTMNQYFWIDGLEKTYVGIGFGPYWLKPAGDGAELVIGAKLSLGSNLTDRVFVEANYNFTDAVGGRGDRGDSLVLSVGCRL
ncbi:MAG: hypothetical protein ACYC1M_18440 [Armatimonadota bacterium]